MKMTSFSSNVTPVAGRRNQKKKSLQKKGHHTHQDAEVHLRRGGARPEEKEKERKHRAMTSHFCRFFSRAGAEERRVDAERRFTFF